MSEAWVLGVGMMRFGRSAERGVKALAREALERALADCDLERRELQAVYFANSGWGVNGGQDCVRGQVALRPSGIAGIPIVNVENACAGGATALHAAILAVRSGEHDVVLSLGADKLSRPSRLWTFASFLGGLDVEAIPELVEKAAELSEPTGNGSRSKRARPKTERRSKLAALPRQLRDALAIADHYQLDVGALARSLVGSKLRGGGGRSPFMDVYAFAAREHMHRYGTTEHQLAMIAAKNHEHGALNPLAQLQTRMTAEEVLADAPVAPPLTRSMCAPIGDGAAAAIVCSPRFAKRHGASRAIRVRASVLVSGRRASEKDESEGASERASRRAYELAGVGPDAISFAEVHDATAFGELQQAEALGFCERGLGGVLAESGATRIGGRIPLNPSGGLECRGHPIGASGLAQIHELVSQLRGEAGARQIERARLGLAENGGGFLGGEEAALGVHVLEGGRR